LLLDIDKDRKECEKIPAVGECFACVHLMQNCFGDHVTERIPACERITELKELAEWTTTLLKTLSVIISLSFHQSAKEYSCLYVGSCVTWHGSTLALRKPPNRVESSFYLPL
jgi:hypothetical protein